MTAHVADELPLLLTGEASREVVLDVAAHLRTCVDCQHELVSAVVAHASLSSAHRFAPDIVADPSRVDAGTAPAQRMPDLSAVFAQVRQEAASPVRRPPARRTRYLVGAAAAAVVIGGGAYALVATLGNGDDHPSGQTVQLAAYDKGTTSGEATVSGSEMHIDAATLPQLPGKGYEVWLTDRARKSMQPVGWIGPDGTATINVPHSLMSKYADIEVSVQKLGGPYPYSNVSVLRGPYTT